MRKLYFLMQMAEVENLKLGQKVKCEISGYVGYVTIIGEHITGCTRIEVSREGERGSKSADSEFFYPQQLHIDEEETKWTEMAPPDEDLRVKMGQKVIDTVTKCEGYVVIINRHLFNCPQVALSPESDDVTEKKDLIWVDVPRCKPQKGSVRFTDEMKEANESESNGNSGSVGVDKSPSNDKP